MIKWGIRITTFGASEFKGKLIYQEEWSKKQRFKDRSHIVMAIVIILMACILIVMGVMAGMASVLGGDSGAGFTFAFLIGISIVLILMGFVMRKVRGRIDGELVAKELNKKLGVKK